MPHNTSGLKKRNVVYVSKRNTKTLKDALDQHSFLDKNYRISAAVSTVDIENPSTHVAVPITEDCALALKGKNNFFPWSHMIVAIGFQEVNYSSAVWGALKSDVHVSESYLRNRQERKKKKKTSCLEDAENINRAEKEKRNEPSEKSETENDFGWVKILIPVMAVVALLLMKNFKFKKRTS